MPQRNGNEQTTPKAPRGPRSQRPSAQPNEATGNEMPRQDSGASQGRQTGFQQIGRMISENPLPVGMIWIGAGWLALKQLSRGRSGQGSQPLETVKGSVGSAGESVGQAMSATQDAVGRLLGGAQHFVATIGEQAPRAAEQAVGTASSQATRAQTAIGGLLEEKPLAVTAAAMAGGAALGLIAPTTRTEAETLAGPTKELVTKAEALVSETMDTFEQAVGQQSSGSAANGGKQRRSTTGG